MSISFEQLLSKCKEIMRGKHLFIVQDLLVLKIINDLFEKERREIRKDFLVRGICSKEVDGLIEEPEYFKGFYIPQSARWHNLTRLQKEASLDIYHALNDIVEKNDIDIPLFNTKRLSIPSGQSLRLVKLIDFYNFSPENIKEMYRIIHNWSQENEISSNSLMLLQA
ncbi:type I restriction-modification system subunit M N-terminal domain-containing protein [Heyndrickxia sporothermodurans]|uniref:N6 adenine-specific DNA methyltransferase N-terminal domain-containing protein n=1 Tax=Heyndrickxia sporothermodurans TaxID=46224 RepID=A0AB37HG53_9BACI|nr:type I restriction-modification system subunit M N-terminal domain-containing protein [Heyndrickxia sporothermodurans]MBL5767661.1 hypothetical protein [Heyndrickxia sporothermodurans]MBL5771164.1 hypothetical protein [Heyndrickxia sporothermodurans]MBL5775032.1 hypothetical protein [Heyndrickxia sporothermodurans]MBL5778235.1 hypothetical protein [Heyndrickxia sporothermodurans]MBL5781933.1 hypothetical protein [Heyndrickxia sporothermodurans]